MYIRVCMGVCVCACMPACGSQRLTVGIFFNCSLLCYLRQDLFLDPQLTRLAKLAGQKAPGLLLLLPFQCWNYGYAAACGFLMWVQGIELRSHTCVVSTLLIELSLQTKWFVF